MTIIETLVALLVIVVAFVGLFMVWVVVPSYVVKRRAETVSVESIKPDASA